MDRGPSDAEDRAYEARINAEIDAALTALPRLEGLVLRLYFGLGAHPPMAIEDVAADLGMTQERARQLKDSGLVRLREGPDDHAGAAALPLPDRTVLLDSAAATRPPRLPPL